MIWFPNGFMSLWEALYNKVGLEWSSHGMLIPVMLDCSMATLTPSSHAWLVPVKIGCSNQFWLAQFFVQ